MAPLGALAESRHAAETSDLDDYAKAIRAGRLGPYDFVSLLGLSVRAPLEITRRVARGLPFTSLERFQRSSGLSLRDLGEVAEITPSTLHRRKRERRLEPQESDRLLRVARVFGRALELFEGDAAAARDWLGAPQRGLGGQRPLALATTDVGAREVEALVDRLEQGVLA